MAITCTAGCGEVVTITGKIVKGALVPAAALCQINKASVEPCEGGAGGFGSNGRVKISFHDDHVEIFEVPGIYTWIAPENITSVTVQATYGGDSGHDGTSGQGGRGGRGGQSGTGSAVVTLKSFGNPYLQHSPVHRLHHHRLVLLPQNHQLQNHRLRVRQGQTLDFVNCHQCLQSKKFQTDHRPQK